jgi:hypothetical protein
MSAIMGSKDNRHTGQRLTAPARRRDRKAACRTRTRAASLLVAWLSIGSFFLSLMAACRARTVDEWRTGTIVGTVTDAKSGAPVEKTIVLVRNGAMTLTDAAGHFAIHRVESGKVVVRATRRDRTPTSAGVTVVPGQVSTVTLRSTTAPPACCHLAGAWNLTLVLEKSDDHRSLPIQALGTIRFGDPAPDQDLRQFYQKDDPTLDEFGESVVDLRPFGSRITDRISPAVHDSPAQGSGGATEKLPGTRLGASGYVHDGDEVSIELSSDITDVDWLTLEGRIDGTTIRGRWDHRPGPGKHRTYEGSFVMTRAPTLR